MAEAANKFNVVVVGAGPSGLLLALLLAKEGIPVTVLEKSVEIDRNPRASFYSSPTLYELRRAGLMEDIMKDGFVPNGVAWREMDGSTICTIHVHDEPGKETTVSLPLDELLPIMAEHLGRHPSAKVLLNHEVVSIGQDNDQAWVNVKTPEGERKFQATYIVGCDGANSKIRRELFGGSFPGFTWDKQIVATNVYVSFSLPNMSLDDRVALVSCYIGTYLPNFAMRKYPRFRQFNWISSNFILHPDHFPMIAQIAKDGLLRITYGEEGNLTREQMQERQPWKFKQFVPGSPDPSEYQIRNFSPYKIHQRCAESFRVGRFLLAADAAHICNPFGGMGLTGGLVDVGNLYDCLYGIYTEQLDDSILDKYSEIRIQKYKEIIDPVSSGNIRRLWDPSQETIANEPFFQAVKRAEADPEFAKQMRSGSNAVMHDFTQYYKQKRGSADS